MTTTIWERVNAALSGLAKPMAAGYYAVATNAELPDEYLVYLEVSAFQQQAADDEETSRLHHVQISYFNRAGLAGMPAIAAALVAAGFTRGPERDLPYEPDTRHFSHALEFYYLEEE